MAVRMLPAEMPDPDAVLHTYAGRLVTLGVEELLLLVFITWLGFNSMAVKIAAQIVVYVNHDPLRPGDVGIFCVDGDMLCKQYYRDPMGTVYLFSLNRRRSDADQVFTAGSGRSLTCFGRVMLHTPPLPL